MHTPPSVYEMSRDDHRSPAYWKIRDNACTPHFHSAMEIIYLLSGEMETLIDGSPQRVAKDHLVVVSSYSVHRYETPEASECLILTIPTDYIPSFSKRTGGRGFSQSVLSPGRAAQEIGACIQRLLDYPDNSGDSYLVRGQIYTVLGILLEYIPLQDQAVGDSQALVREILRYLHNNYRHPLSQERIASFFGYSRSRISHIFNRQVGCSIPEYIGTLRSRAAATMLLEEPDSITTVAMEAGFESIRTFYRSFQSCFGVTPSQFVKLSTGKGDAG